MLLILTRLAVQDDLGGGRLQGALNIAFSLYILAAVTPYELAARKTLDALLPALPEGPAQRFRSLLETLLFFAGAHCLTLAVAHNAALDSRRQGAASEQPGAHPARTGQA